MLGWGEGVLLCDCNVCTHMPMINVNSLMCSMMSCELMSLNDKVLDVCELLQKAVIRWKVFELVIDIHG